MYNGKKRSVNSLTKRQMVAEKSPPPLGPENLKSVPTLLTYQLPVALK
jgi:hypothetical protein